MCDKGIPDPKMENQEEISGDKQSSTTSQPNKAKPKDLASKYAQWDRLAKEVEKTEEEEEDGVDSLFKKIYRDSSDDVKKAMIKSFSESQGTVLSTNWSEIKKQRTDVKPPEGSEFKSYEK